MKKQELVRKLRAAAEAGNQRAAACLVMLEELEKKNGVPVGGRSGNALVSFDGDAISVSLVAKEVPVGDDFFAAALRAVL